MQGLVIRPLEPRDSFEELTDVVRSAYQELADLGFRYWGTHQSVEDTEHRCTRGPCLVAELDGRLVGTATCRQQIHHDSDTPDWYLQPGVWIINQVAVRPEMKGQGVGAKLMDACERTIFDLGGTEAALDTAEGAHHLIRMYKKRGYRHVGMVDWEGTNYLSVLLSKRLRVDLHTARLRMREFRQEDWESVYEWWQMPEFNEAYPPGSRSEEVVQKMVQKFVEEQEVTPRANYSLALEHDGRMIGLACMRCELGRGCANIGYELHPEFWRRGLMREAIQEIQRMAFEELEMARVEAWVYRINKRSAAFLESQGFTQEGCLRDKVPWGEGRMDDCMYAKLRSEWLS